MGVGSTQHYVNIYIWDLCLKGTMIYESGIYTLLLWFLPSPGLGVDAGMVHWARRISSGNGTLECLGLTCCDFIRISMISTDVLVQSLFKFNVELCVARPSEPHQVC